MGSEEQGERSERYVFLAVDDKLQEVAYEDIEDIVDVDMPEANVAEGKALMLFNECNSNSNIINFISDTGSTEHIVNTLNSLVDIKNLKNEIVIKSANAAEGTSLKATKAGSIVTRLDCGKIVKIKGVLYAHHYSKNLLSIRKLVRNGVDVVVGNAGISVVDSKSKEVLQCGTFVSKFWCMNFKNVECLVNELDVENERSNFPFVDHSYAKNN